MEQILQTPRLKLTYVEKAEIGSQEFKWLHEIRTDKGATWWSLFGPSITPEDTINHLKTLLPNPTDAPTALRINYAVHEILPQENSTRFIGIITIRSLSPQALHLPEPFVPALPSTTLLTELSYMFLPCSWGKGYATESINALIKACESSSAREVWRPYKGVYLRGIVGEKNKASLRVMDKMGMENRGVYTWRAAEGEKGILVAGEVKTVDRIVVFGRYLNLGGEEGTTVY